MKRRESGAARRDGDPKGKRPKPSQEKQRRVAKAADDSFIPITHTRSSRGSHSISSATMMVEGRHQSAATSHTRTVSRCRA